MRVFGVSQLASALGPGAPPTCGVNACQADQSASPSLTPVRLRSLSTQRLMWQRAERLAHKRSALVHFRLHQLHLESHTQPAQHLYAD